MKSDAKRILWITYFLWLILIISYPVVIYGTVLGDIISFLMLLVSTGNFIITIIFWLLWLFLLAWLIAAVIYYPIKIICSIFRAPTRKPEE